MRKDFTVRPYVCSVLAREEGFLLEAPPVSHQSAKEGGFVQVWDVVLSKRPWSFVTGPITRV
jgi:hypothetical protein